MDNQDAFSRYVAARAAFADADEELRSCAWRADSIAGRFARNARNFGFDGVAPALPPEVLALKRSRSLTWPAPHIVPARDWPTAQEIQRTVVAWHTARMAVIEAYESLPRRQRDAAAPPPQDC